MALSTFFGFPTPGLNLWLRPHHLRWRLIFNLWLDWWAESATRTKGEQLIHHGQALFCVLQVVADAPCRQLVGETWHPGDDLTLGDHDEEDRDQRETGEGADDVEGVLGRGVVAPPGDRAGQPVRFGDVLAPAEQREAGPDRRHQPDARAHYPDVGSFHPHSCEESHANLGCCT